MNHLRRATRWAKRLVSSQTTPAALGPASEVRVTSDLKAWCHGRPGASYQVVSPPRHIQRTPPHTLEPAQPSDLAHYLDVRAPERGLAQVARARLMNAQGLIHLPDGSWVGETVALTPAGQQHVLAAKVSAGRPWPRQAIRQRGRFFSALVIGSSNYYHWIHDIILKLWRVLPLLPGDVRIIVPADLRPFQRETLALLGLGAERLLPYREGEAWELDELFVAVPYPKPIVEDAEALAWLRDCCQTAYGIQPAGRGNRRIYVSRALDGHFRTINKPEIIALLQARGFEVCLPGRLSLADQAALFSDARLIVGTGTGLANMLFAPPGAQIVQWQDEAHFVYALWTISAALGHAYWWLRADTVPSAHPGLSDFVVPPEKLSATLDRLV